MSATELIKQVAALPPKERALFEQLLQNMQNGAQSPESGRQSEWPDFSERLRRIYGDKVAPDSQGIIDDGRGDR